MISRSENSPSSAQRGVGLQPGEASFRPAKNESPEKQKVKTTAKEVFEILSGFLHKIEAKLLNPKAEIKTPDKSIQVTLPYPRGTPLKSNLPGSKLETFLGKPCGAEALIEHSKKEFYTENIHFLKSAEHLQSLLEKGENQKAKIVWIQMRELFLNESSLLPINIDGGPRKALLAEDGSSIKNPEFRAKLAKARESIEDTLIKDKLSGAKSIEIEESRLQKAAEKERVEQAALEKIEALYSQMNL